MRISDWSSDVCSSDLPAPPEKSKFPSLRSVRRVLEHGLSLEVHPSGIGPLVQAKDRHMNKVFLAGRITSDVTRFGNDTKSGVSFTLVTSKTVIKAGQVQTDGKGHTETWDAFHTVKAFGGLGQSVDGPTTQSDKLNACGEIRAT